MRKRIEYGLYQYFDREGRPGNLVIQFKYKGERVFQTLDTTDVKIGRQAIQEKRDEIDAQFEKAIELEMFGEDITLEEALNSFKAGDWSEDSVHQRDSISRAQQVCGFLGNPRCMDITTSKLKQLKRHLESENIGTTESPRLRRPGTINRYMVSLKTILKACYDEGLIPKLPNFKKVMVSETQFRRDRLVSKAEFNQIRRILMRERRTPKSAAMRKQVAEVLTIAWYTGMRIGEILDIRFGRHINMQRRTIMISADIAKGKAIRTLGMHDKVFKILDNAVPDKNGVIFSFDVNFVSKCWRQARDEMGIDDPNFVPHAIRHTVATDLLRDGHSTAEVQALLGHQSVSTTMIYSHLVAEDVSGALLSRR